MRRFNIPLTILFSLAFLPLAFSQNDMTEKGGFSVNPNEEHGFLFVLANRPNDLQEMRGGVTKYIWKYHPNDKLKVMQIQVDGDLATIPLMHVTGFTSQTQAMDFYNGLKKNRPDFLQMGLTKDYFPLSKSNFEAIVRAKSLDGYKAFFEQNYLK